jgi:hypothetical protein
MKEDIEKLKEILCEHEQRISKLETLISKPITKIVTTDAKKGMSLKEFILLKNPNDDNTKTLCIGYYLEKYAEYTSFSTEDLKKAFGSAKEPHPGNINDRINKNIAKGFMMEAEEKKNNRKAWMLTSSGEKFVENELGKKKETK